MTGNDRGDLFGAAFLGGAMEALLVWRGASLLILLGWGLVVTLAVWNVYRRGKSTSLRQRVIEKHDQLVL